MASTPTTKSQVQAYQFVLRRMESALVRKDAVMLHDPMGSHKRATVAGVIIACVGIIGFLVWGLFGGKGSVPNPGSIVIGKESGSVYVVTADPVAQKRLIPMLNMASARLLVMQQGGAQPGQAPQPTMVKEAALADFPRAPRTGMPNAPTFLPDARNQAAPMWAICDAAQGKDFSDPKAQRAAKVTTTVIGGDDPNGLPLWPDQSLFVQDQTSRQQFLVYYVDGLPGQPNTHAVRSPIDPSTDPAVREMFGLNGAVPRTISTNMLNAIPLVPKLKSENAPQDGSPAPYNPRFKIGDVIQATVPGQPYKYFVLLPSGKQEISRGAAAVLHAAKTRSRDIPNFTGQLTDIHDADKDEFLPVAAFPAGVPKPVPFQQASTSCLSWKDVNGAQQIEVKVGQGDAARRPAVQLAQADGPERNVDFFYMPAGKGAVMHAAANEAGASSGPIQLVTDQGVKFGVKDVATAQGLGIISGPGDIKAGPASILGTLPKGAFLDPAEASYVYDSIQTVPAPNRPLPKPQGS